MNYQLHRHIHVNFQNSWIGNTRFEEYFESFECKFVVVVLFSEFFLQELRVIAHGAEFGYRLRLLGS